MADLPSWAATLLSASLAQHGNDARALRRAIGEFQRSRTLYDSQESARAYDHIVAGLKARMEQLDAPAEAERGP